MSESTNKPSAGTATVRFEVGRQFTVGGVVPIERSLYLKRPADDELFRLAMSGEYAHVFAARQSGKSSLTARVAERLRDHDRLVAVIDLEQIGSRDDRADLGRWFYSFAFRLLRQLRIKIDLQDWWQDKANLTNRQRLTELFWDLVLSNTESPVTVFIDSPQSFDALPFAEELLGAVDALHTARAAEPELTRLNFVLLAVGEPLALGSQADLSLFTGSHRVELAAFTRPELEPIADWLPLDPDATATVLDRIHHWTGGQPFLTMKLARRVARQAATSKDNATNVDECVRQLFASPAVLETEPHLGAIQQALLAEIPDRDKALTLYGSVRKGDRIAFNHESALQRRLLDEGLLRVDEHGSLVVANRIYAYAFTSRWANEHLAVRLRTTVVAIAAVLLALVIPLWYVELLPQRWIRTLQNPPVLEEATEAHERMRAWPGHRQHANRLLADYLERRSLAATGIADALEFDRLLRELPGTRVRADELLAAFWDRDALRRELAADRDGALTARLYALERASDTTSAARRRAADSLIGADYARLITVRRLSPAIDDAALSADGQSVTALTGTMVQQFPLGAAPGEAVAAWQAAALDVYPVLSRLPVEGRGAAGPFALTVDVTHDRVSDLSLRLTAPSGQSALLSGNEAEMLPAGGIRFSSATDPELEALEAETLAGGWTLSVVDRMPVIAGTLNGWKLELDRHGVAESTPQATLLREPVVAPASRAVLSPRARYVVALPESASGVAQVWDTSTRQAVSSLPIDPADRIVGFVLDERVVLVAKPQGLAAWALATGERSWAPPVQTPLLTSALSLNRQFLATVAAGASTELVVFDLIEEVEVARLPAAAELAAIAVANDGAHVAIAYADQTVRLWQTGSDAPETEVAMTGAVTGLDFSPDNRCVLIRTATGSLSVWSIDDPSAPLEHRRSEHAWEIDFGAGGEHFALGSAASGFQVVAAETLEARSPLLRPGSMGNHFRARYRDAHDALLLFAPESGIVKVYRVPPVAPAQPSTAAPLPVTRLSPDGRLVAVSDRPGGIRVAMAADTVEPAASSVGFLGHSTPVDAARFSRDGALVATAARDGTVRLWDADTSSPRSYFLRPGWSAIADIAFSADGLRVAVAAPGAVAVYDTASGAEIGRREFGEPVSTLTFGAGSDDMIVGFSTGAISIVTVSSGFVGDRIETGAAPVAALAVAGPYLAVADEGGVLSIIRMGAVAPWQQVRTGETCRELASAPDGSAVVCRTANWVYRVPLQPVIAASDVEARLLPAQPLLPGIGLDASGRVVTMLVRSAGIVSVELSFDRSDVGAADAVTPATFVDQWIERLGPLPESVPLP